MNKIHKVDDPVAGLFVAALFYNYNRKHTDKYLSWQDLVSLLSKPLQCCKTQAKAIAPQLSGVKTKLGVLAHNQMTLLWVDIDEGNYSIIEIKRKLQALGITSAIIYSTASSEINTKRWHILIELEKPFICRYWGDLQEALALLLHGDSAAVRVQQILYAPCTPPTSNHYEHDVITGTKFSKPPAAIAKIITDLKAKRKAIHQNITATIRNRHAIQGEFNIQQINDTLDIYTLLEDYGYKHVGRKWLSPKSSSRKAGLIAFPDGRWFSHHSSDQGIGYKTEGGVCGDAFDLVTYYEYGNDYCKSLANLCVLLDPEGQKKRRFDWMKRQKGGAS